MQNVKSPHQLSATEVLDSLQVTSKGLSSSEVQERRQHHGSNQLPTVPPPTLLAVFIRQFKNPLIYILAFAAFISVVLEHYLDFSFILFVLLLNAVIGTLQEVSAEKNAQSLRSVSRSRVRVRRSGQELEVDSIDLVPGDWVFIESGTKVPADIRLVSVNGLEVDESLLTGESLPVRKDADRVLTSDVVIGDQKNMAFAGSFVTRGRGQGVVVSTGLKTAIGEIANTVIHHQSPQTPLLIRMELFTKKLSIAMVFIILGMGLVLWFRGEALTEILLISVALGVSAIPEGLPVALTVALSIATKRMAKRNVIVRGLSAVEALGSCTFIGTDKTGTLTINELTIERLVLPNKRRIDLRDASQAAPDKAPDAADLIRAGLLCNEAHWSLSEPAVGDSVDVAFLKLAHQFDQLKARHQFQLVDSIPFESENQYAATIHQSATGEIFLSAKGSFEKLSAMCASIDPFLEEEVHQLAREGYRVLAVAGKRLQNFPEHFTSELMQDIDFYGIVGMIDPPREDVTLAIQQTKAAGVAVAMITGDHPVTALAIAKTVGLAGEESQAVTGKMLQSIQSLESFDQATKGQTVFSRVEPNQKLQIVESLIRQGHFVAVTGDGVNDAPALKMAHVGVAMGKSGTDVAKETADLIITDDRFSSIVSGIEEGRVAYSNVRKVVYLLVSTGAAEVVLFLLSILTGLPMPLTAVQILWLNLVTNGIQHVALAFEPKEGDELNRPPRPPKESIFNRVMLERILLSALVIGGVSYGFFLQLNQNGTPLSEIQNQVLLLMVLFENVLVGVARSEEHWVLKLSPFRNPFLLIGVLGAFMTHALAMHLPILQKFLGTAPLGLDSVAQGLGMALSVFVALEAHKAMRKFLTR